MPQLVIEHDGQISNYHALQAVTQFITLNFTSKRSQRYLDTRKITLTECGLHFQVQEKSHADQEHSPCSAAFLVTQTT
jgi:hypothetical protein